MRVWVFPSVIDFKYTVSEWWIVKFLIVIFFHCWCPRSIFQVFSCRFRGWAVCLGFFSIYWFLFILLCFSFSVCQFLFLVLRVILFRFRRFPHLSWRYFDCWEKKMMVRLKLPLFFFSLTFRVLWTWCPFFRFPSSCRVISLGGWSYFHWLHQFFLAFFWQWHLFLRWVDLI